MCHRSPDQGDERPGRRRRTDEVDAEGTEPLVLWGARDLIRRCRPLILFERNAKTVTDSMQSMIDIPAEVRDFRIEDYASTLGYDPPITLGGENYLLWQRSRL